MNENSVICQYISKHPNDWEEYFTKELDLRVKHDTTNTGYMILTYNITCDFTNPIVREARGIIINKDTLDVVCWPFNKFANFSEPYADQINWNTAKVQEKIDGSIIKMWYDKIVGKWQWSTNGTIYADGAKVNTATYTFGQVVERATNYKNVISKQPELNRDYTYIFELVSPYNRIVIDYDSTVLYHIGTRNNITGQEYDIDIGIIKPRQYSLRNLSECIEAVKNLNDHNKRIDHEGFVVVDADFHRVKVKSPEYVYTNKYLSSAIHHKGLLLLLRNSINFADDLKAIRPYDADRIDKYTLTTKEINDDALSIYQTTKEAIKNGIERKSIAGMLKEHMDLSSIGFSLLKPRHSVKFQGMEDEEIVKTLLSELTDNSYTKIFEKYYSRGSVK